MAPVSRNKLSQDQEEKIVGILISELCKITLPEKLAPLLNSLLSNSEKIMLAKRMAVFVMTEHGLPDVRIAECLHLTADTVARLRLTYWLAKERKEPVVETAKSSILWEILMKYLLPAAFGKIPKKSIF